MSGHSKWASIKHKKAIVDSRRGKLFTKLTRAITVAAREGGGDIEGNPSLALAVQKAKDASMPKDNIERAIAKGTGADQDADAFESIVYEGYGPAGVAMLVEALTDNRNRTSADVRHLFTKHNGNLGEPGSVNWIFERKGEILVDGSRYTEDDLMGAIDAGAEDVTGDGDVFEVVTGPTDLTTVRQALEGDGVEIQSGRARLPRHDEGRGRGARRRGADAPDRRPRRERRRAGRARELRDRRRRSRAHRQLASRSTAAAAGSSRCSRSPRAPSTRPGGNSRGQASALRRRIPRVVVVLGIDPGTAHTGYGVVLARGRTLGALDGGEITTGPSQPLERRLATIHARICDLIAEHQPDAVAIEELYFGKNVRTAFAVGQARGVILLAAGMAGLPCFSYTPQQIKQAVCGSGGADKVQVQRWSARCSRCPICPSPTTPPTLSPWPSATRTASRCGPRSADSG